MTNMKCSENEMEEKHNKTWECGGKNQFVV